MNIWILALLACNGEDVPADTLPAAVTDDSGAASTEDTDDTDTEPPTDTDTDTDSPTDTATTLQTDPFLSGDPATLVGIFTMSWEIGVGRDGWWVEGYTFQPGSWSWTGQLLQPATGLDTCEVRDGDPEWQMQLENFGAVDLFSGADHVWTISTVAGSYSGQAQMADVDPRGNTWDYMFEGSFIPFFQLNSAITFPEGELVVTAPLPAEAVDAALPLEVRWGGPPADHVVLDLSAGQVRIRCLATDDGSFDVDPALLAMLPAGPLSLAVVRRAAAGPAAGNSGGWVQLYAQQDLTTSLTVL